MILFVVDSWEESKWCPMHFWTGSFRHGLEKHNTPNQRIRRVRSREEADLLDKIMPILPYMETSYGFEWDLDTFEWQWPNQPETP